MKSEKNKQLAVARGKASREGMVKCVQWIEECRKIGWKEKQLDDLECLFWLYRDSDGGLKRHEQTKRDWT